MPSDPPRVAVDTSVPCSARCPDVRRPTGPRGRLRRSGSTRPGRKPPSLATRLEGTCSTRRLRSRTLPLKMRRAAWMRFSVAASCRWRSRKCCVGPQLGVGLGHGEAAASGRRPAGSRPGPAPRVTRWRRRPGSGPRSPPPASPARGRRSPSRWRPGWGSGRTGAAARCPRSTRSSRPAPAGGRSGCRPAQTQPRTTTAAPTRTARVDAHRGLGSTMSGRSGWSSRTTAGTSSRNRVDSPTSDRHSLAGSWGAATRTQRAPDLELELAVGGQQQLHHLGVEEHAGEALVLGGDHEATVEGLRLEVDRLGIPTFSSRRVARVSGWTTRWGKAWSVSVRQQVR